MIRRYEPLLNRWLNKKSRKPLIIRGARQVGKSTLVRQFALSEKRRLFEVNLERYPQLAPIIEKLDPYALLQEVEFICNQGKFNPDDSLLFFDEIQGLPQMLQCLRYFYELTPEIPLISAGSLLEFALANHAFPMPVGRVEYFYMGPMNWEEFLRAKEEDQLLDWLQNYQINAPIPVTLHTRMLALLREYFLIGGMPEAVKYAIEGAAWDEIFEIQQSILQTYRDDFSKYAHGNTLVRLQKTMDYMGYGTGQKIKYVNIDRDSQSREIKQALDLLLKAGVIFQVIHSHADGIPLNARATPNIYKLYNLDIALYNRICNLNYISEQEMLEQRFINEGVLAEQFIAQQFYFEKGPSLQPELHYWLRENSSKNAEVDFILQVQNHIIPIEVKSGKSGSLKSLLQYNLEKDPKINCRFDLNKPSLQKIDHQLNQQIINSQLLSLPLYMCNQTSRLLSSLL
jgi:predicted AAA+ superfamily ATPase